MPDRWILHFDLDAMFAAVEMLLDPSLAGKPVIVGASPGSRGVVSTCSYEAREFGVHSAMPIGEARRRCPDGVFLPVRHSLYSEYSRKVIAVVCRFAETVQQISIDEAFIDLSAEPDPVGLSREVKESIRREVGLVASVGLATNKLVAKVATDCGKPDGFVVVAPGDEAAFLAPLPVRRLWGVGPKTASRLESAGILTIGELALKELPELATLVGLRHGKDLLYHAQGHDDSIVAVDREVKSISDEMTFQSDEGDRRVLWRVIQEQALQCSTSLKKRELLARTVTLKMRFADFQTWTRSLSLSVPTDDPEQLADAGAALMRLWWAPESRPLRLLGLRVSNLVPLPVLQQLRLQLCDTTG